MRCYDCRCLPVLRKLDGHFSVRPYALMLTCRATPLRTRRRSESAHDRQWPVDPRATTAPLGTRTRSGPSAIGEPPAWCRPHTRFPGRKPFRRESARGRSPFMAELPCHQQLTHRAYSHVIYHRGAWRIRDIGYRSRMVRAGTHHHAPVIGVGICVWLACKRQWARPAIAGRNASESEARKTQAQSSPAVCCPGWRRRFSIEENTDPIATSSSVAC